MELKTKAGLALAIAGGCLAIGGLIGAGATSAQPVPTQQVDLHNNTAEAGTDCPDAVDDYWHFIISPNNGTYHFVSMHLYVDGVAYDFSAWTTIIKNGSQEDNVFVKVPAGKTLADLQMADPNNAANKSYALVTPNTPAPGNFNLSHLCDGNPVDTTSPDTTSPDTTSPDTTSPDTTSPDTTAPDTTAPDTTSPDTTSPDTTAPDTTSPDTTAPDTTAPDTTAPDTTAPNTTTSDTGGEGNESIPSTSQGSGGNLPDTGSDGSSLVMLGAFMVVVGLAMATMSRRRSDVR